MCGGFLRGGCDFCSHFNRNIVPIAKVRKISAATLYVGITPAFASVMRCLVSGNCMSDQNVVRVFSQLGFAPAIFDQFKVVLQDDPALVKASVPANLQNAFSCCLNNSFFHIKGIQDVCIYNTGTGAGNPLADVAYAVLAARVLSEVDIKLVKCDLHVPIPNTCPSIFSDQSYASCNFIGVSYVDDTFSRPWIHLL